jgi:hypothetical protein
VKASNLTSVQEVRLPIQNHLYLQNSRNNVEIARVYQKFLRPVAANTIIEKIFTLFIPR